MAVSLTKGSSLSLTKPDGSALTKIRLGLGWDAKKKGGFFGNLMGGEIDLDASAILLDGSGNVIESVYFNQLRSADGAVRHIGDNLTGDGDGDDEQIIVDLAGISPSVKTVLFTINSYSGQKFDQVENVFARVVDISGNRDTEIVRYNLAESRNTTGVFIAKVSRGANGWEFTAIGDFRDGRTVANMVPNANQYA